MKKMSAYIFITLLVVVGLELFFRSNFEEIAVLSDKQLMKSAILKNVGLQNVTLFGSSRSNDAFDSRIFNSHLSELNPSVDGKFESFNAASIRMSFEKYLYSLQEAFEDEASKFYLIEISEGLFSTKGFRPPEEDWDKDDEENEVAEANVGAGSENENESDSAGAKLTPTSFGSAEANLDQHTPTPLAAPEVDIAKEESWTLSIETKLKDFFYDNSALVQQRQSLKVKTLSRLLLLKCAGFINSERWFRSGVLKSFYAEKDIEFSTEDFVKQAPIVYQRIETPVDFTHEDHADFQVRLVQILQSGPPKKYVFINLPVKKSVRHEECNDLNKKFYNFLVAKLETTVLDFSCLDLPENYFKDSKHLNYRGRVFFSKLLAYHLTEMDLVKNAL